MVYLKRLGGGGLYRGKEGRDVYNTEGGGTGCFCAVGLFCLCTWWFVLVLVVVKGSTGGSGVRVGVLFLGKL